MTTLDVFNLCVSQFEKFLLPGKILRFLGNLKAAKLNQKLIIMVHLFSSTIVYTLSLNTSQLRTILEVEPTGGRY